MITYASVITLLNIRHIQAMPEATRSPVESLSPLVSAGESVTFIESLPVSNVFDEPGDGLVRRNVHVEYRRQTFPVSENVWVNTRYARSDPARYLNRYRAGHIHFAKTKLARLFLVEVQQSFKQQGDQPRVNLWLFPSESGGLPFTDHDEPVVFVPNKLTTEAKLDPTWRAVFADSHQRIVRAFPALAAFIIGLAALGSLIFNLWRTQPWPVAVSTVTFGLPIVSAAPFLTAFGWLPLIAAIVISFVVATAVLCALSHSFIPSFALRLNTNWGRKLFEAAIKPAVALLVGTTLVVSLASVSIIPIEGLGSDSPGELFAKVMIRPAVGLLLGGTGTWLILTLIRFGWRWRESK